MAVAKKARSKKEAEVKEDGARPTVAQVQAKIKAGDYTATLPLGASKEDREKFDTQSQTKDRYLKRDMLAATGLTNHEKARAALKYAEELGTVGETVYPSEVLKHLARIAGLMGTLAG